MLSCETFLEKNIPTMAIIVNRHMASTEFIVCGEKRWLPTTLARLIVGGDEGDAAAWFAGEVFHLLPAGGHRQSGPVVVAAEAEELSVRSKRCRARLRR